MMKKTMFDPKLYDLKALIIEDCKFSREEIMFTLQNLGCNVTTADNGERALEILKGDKENIFDLIIIDIEMPIINGFEILREIKRCKLSPEAVLCSFSIIISERNYLDLGFHSFIPKPPDTNHIIGLLEFVAELKLARS